MNIYAELSERDEISLFLNSEGYETKNLMHLECNDGGWSSYLVNLATPSSAVIGVIFLYLKSRKKKFRVQRDGTEYEAEGISQAEFIEMVKAVGEVFITPKKKK